MTCRLLNVVTALSLLLFAALAGLWAYLFASAMYLPGGEPLWTAEMRGERHVLTYDGGVLRYEVWRPAPEVRPPTTTSRVISFSNVRRRTFGVSLPIPAALAALAVPPVVWSWRRNRRRERAARRLCPACGYDLRATPGRCPESGAVATE